MQTNVHIVKAMIFPVVIYKCKNWTIKKAEHQIFHVSNYDAREDTWDPLESKEMKPPILWPHDVKDQLIGKDSDKRERLRAEVEVGDKGWDGWIASSQTSSLS